MNIKENTMPIVYAELWELLNYTSYYDLKKIPQNLKDKIKAEKNNRYNYRYDINKTMKDQDILEDTKNLYALIYYRYCCTDEEKAKYTQIWIENDKKEELMKQEVYNPENLFVPKDIDTIQENNLLPIVEEENFFKKMLKKIKILFRK